MRITAIALLVMVAFALSAAAGTANHLPRAKCSDSGNACAGIRNARGVHVIEFTTSSLRGRIDVCVKRRGGGRRECVDDRLEQVIRGLYTSKVRWERQFDAARGAYAVTWRKRGRRVGPRLGLHDR
ncbi:MAG: hypothetical protein ACRDKX_03265 [Solirubrobacterales bacterium]